MLISGFSKYLKSPQVTTFFTPNPVTAKADSKIEPISYFVVLHDLKKDQWDVKTAKTLAEAYAWTAGRPYELLRNGVKVVAGIPEPGDSLILGYSKEPDFFESNWYRILTAAGVVTGVYLSLHK